MSAPVEANESGGKVSEMVFTLASGSPNLVADQCCEHPGVLRYASSFGVTEFCSLVEDCQAVNRSNRRLRIDRGWFETAVRS